MIKSIFIYVFVFLISIIFAKIQENKKKTSKFLFVIAILFPVLISTIRYGVGTDFFRYRDIYFYIKTNCYSIKTILMYYIEPLFVILNLIGYYIFHDFKFVLFSSSLIFMYFSYLTILEKKETLSITLAYFIFLVTIFSISFNGIRQMIAVSIVFYAYKYILKDNNKKYFLLVLLASLFHKSALFCLLIPILWIDKGNKSNKFYVLFISLIIFIPLLGKIIVSICSYFNIYISYITRTINKTYLFLLYIFPILFLFLLNKKNTNYENGEVIFWKRLYIMQIPIQMLGNIISYSDRLSLYFMISQVILVPMYINTLKYNKNIAIIYSVGWYIFYYIFMFIIMNSNGVYPFIFA